MTLNGVDGYVQFASHLIPTGSYSVTFLAKGPATVTGWFEMISQGGDYGWYIGGDPTAGTIRVTDEWMGTGVLFPTDSKQHRYTLVVDDVADGWKLFIDGVPLATTSALSDVSATTGTDTRLGRQYGNYEEYFGGTIGDLRIYSGALSDTQVNGPEPSGLLLTAGGLCLLAMRRRTHLRPR